MFSAAPVDAASTPLPPCRKVPVPMLPSEIVRIETAMFFADVSDKTIRKWARQDGIGRQAEPHAPLQISMPALLMKVDGETEALEMLRAGERDNGAVRFYLKRAVDLLSAHLAHCRTTR